MKNQYFNGCCDCAYIQYMSSEEDPARDPSRLGAKYCVKLEPSVLYP